jgi:hypothetical protein
VGDRILAFEGNVIHSAEEITSLVRTLKPGDDVELTISRGADILPVHATLMGVAGSTPESRSPRSAADVGKLKRDLKTLQEEAQKLEEKIKALEAAPAR